jgi:hypothetical protein
MSQIAWRLPAVLLAASFLAPASIIAVLPQPEHVEIHHMPDIGPKLKYTVGAEIKVYPARPDQQPGTGLAYLLVGLPAATLFFLLIPVLQRLALRFRLLDD